MALQRDPDMVYEKLPSVIVGVAEMPSLMIGNSHQPSITENIRKLMAREYRNCWFGTYGLDFHPVRHLGKDCLHVNRLGAMTLMHIMETTFEDLTSKEVK